MQNTKAKIFIATPMYGGMCNAAYTSSVVAFTRLCDRNNIHCDIFTLTNESLIQRARNSLAEMFMRSDYTHLFFIDADIGFSAEEALKMIEADKDIICGAYPRKYIDWRAIRECALNGGSIQDMKAASLQHVVNFINADRRPPIDETGCVEVEYSGTGFMLIKRKVLELLRPKVEIYLCDSEVSDNISMNDVIHEYFYVGKEKGTKRLLSEDYAFCDLWRSHGGKIHVAVWITLAHVGTHAFWKGM